MRIINRIAPEASDILPNRNIGGIVGIEKAVLVTGQNPGIVGLTLKDHDIGIARLQGVKRYLEAIEVLKGVSERVLVAIVGEPDSVDMRFPGAPVDTVRGRHHERRRDHPAGTTLVIDSTRGETSQGLPGPGTAINHRHIIKVSRVYILYCVGSAVKEETMKNKNQTKNNN